MINKIIADNFAREWVKSWNSHDLNRILSHYSEDFEMSSPIILQITEEPSGTLKGKNAVGQYWAKALSLFPDLHFDLIATFAGVNSTIINFKWARGSSAEMFLFAPDGKVICSYAHHSI